MIFKCLFVLFLLIVATKPYMSGISDPFRFKDCSVVGNGFTDIGGSCYKVIMVHAGFDRARDFCRAEHPYANLATIRCAQENQGVHDLARSAGLADTCEEYYNSNKYLQQSFWRSQMWIGLTRPNRATKSSWANGADAVYRFWAPEEPNNHEGDETGTEMYLFDGWRQTAPHWNDVAPGQALCAAACEVVTAKSGSGCGLAPCPRSTTAFTTPSSSCVRYYDADCSGVGYGFSNVGGSCYKVLEAYANFDEARALCRSQHPNGDLATIRCDKENQGIYDLSRGFPLLACESYYLHNQFDPGSYYRSQMWTGLRNGSWVNGAGETYRNWNENPNNAHNQLGMATYMNIFEMYHSQWSDIDPSTKMCLVACEVLTRKSGSSC